MTIFEKLQKKIKNDLSITVINLKRVSGGYWHKGSGGFSWVGIDADTKQVIGSTITATKLLKKEKIEIIENVTIGGFVELF